MTTERSGLAALFDTFTGFQRTAALRAAVELEVFTAIGEGQRTPSAIAERARASERGIRMLCDTMAALGFLTKHDGQYDLTEDSAMFLDRSSPIYVGSAIRFINSPRIVEGFAKLTEAVRKGGTVLEHDALAPDHPIWVDFARAMGGLAKVTAELIANLLNVDTLPKGKVLDIAAGHGWFGVTLAQHNPNLEIVGLDWANVLEVAKETAHDAGVADRYRTIEGDALTTDLGRDYDLILVTNLVHHFDPAMSEALFRKVHAALKPGGRAVTLEFIPDEDRKTPVEAVSFSLTMLAMTPGGDAYTYRELEQMLRNAGFTRNELHPLPPSVERVIVSTK